MKTTIKLEGEKKIREMLEQALMLTSVKDYVGEMANFYWQKAQDLLSAMGDEDAQAKVSAKYGDVLMDQPSDKYLVLSALDDYETANAWKGSFEWHVNRMVKDLIENPITIECADDEDPDDVADAWLEIDTKVWERSDGISKVLYTLWHNSAGHVDKHHEYDAMLDLHLGRDRR